MADPRSAKVAARIATMFGLGIGCFNSVIVAIFRDRLGRIFSKDPEVLDLVLSVVRSTCRSKRLSTI